MTEDLDKAQVAIRRCIELKERGSNEAVMRSEFLSHLRGIFPNTEDQRWIDRFSEGSEAHTTVGVNDGLVVSRFIDNLIGSTTIEFEADLGNSSKYDQGFAQVKEQVAGLIRRGIPVSQVRGILSDTVCWYVFDVNPCLVRDPYRCTTDDISLNQVDTIVCRNNTKDSAEMLVKFLRKHLAREKSRPLIAENIANDLGLDSDAYKRSKTIIGEIVMTKRDTDPSVTLSTDLWSSFVDYLEDDQGEFRLSNYVDAVYLNILARLLSANILSAAPIVGNDNQIIEILDGSFFLEKFKLNNLVERDYFGWISEIPSIHEFIPIARRIQNDLYAYSYDQPVDEDLFGHLVTQLANRSKRKLLGQEWTPSWLARHLALKCLDNISKSEIPQVVDMCCGSGAIIAEVIKAARDIHCFKDIDTLERIVTGFDIDPLAVVFARTTWVTTLASEIRNAKRPITVPIYHADSLFATTPLSKSIPLFEKDDHIEIKLDNRVIELPTFLLKSECRVLFDFLINWAHDEACLEGEELPNVEDTRTTLNVKASALGIEIPDDIKDSIVAAIYLLTTSMRELISLRRNGIWAFILRNTYRPSLLAGQFNGLVSNPPWQTMSSRAENSYMSMLSKRAKMHNLLPAGSSFLHLELGTTYLLHAIDRYLKIGASISCLVPGTVLNGSHHENLRQRKYLQSKRPVAFKVTEVWKVDPTPFKVHCSALIGKKVSTLAEADKEADVGAIVDSYGIKYGSLAVEKLGKFRTAWSLGKDIKTVTSDSTMTAYQGADLMPRIAVCIEILDESDYECRVETPKRSSVWGFTTQKAKVLSGKNFSGYVSPKFIHRIAQSENLLPFLLDSARAPIAIPAFRDCHGKWQIKKVSEIRRMGYTKTAQRFSKIDAELTSIGGNTLAERINMRNKLTNQNFMQDDFIVITGAGGKYICSACIPASDFGNVVVDQTLYWDTVADENEAWYRTGMMNSKALTDAIMPFNPKGDFGQRHIHLLPYKVIPIFDSSNSDHLSIAKTGREVSHFVSNLLQSDVFVGNPSKALHQRRRRVREALDSYPKFKMMDELCKIAIDESH